MCPRDGNAMKQQRSVSQQNPNAASPSLLSISQEYGVFRETLYMLQHCETRFGLRHQASRIIATSFMS
jgi:hypothetical protein